MMCFVAYYIADICVGFDATVAVVGLQASLR
jgi:hypothetical protein